MSACNQSDVTKTVQIILPLNLGITLLFFRKGFMWGNLFFSCLCLKNKKMYHVIILKIPKQVGDLSHRAFEPYLRFFKTVDSDLHEISWNPGRTGRWSLQSHQTITQISWTSVGVERENRASNTAQITGFIINLKKRKGSFLGLNSPWVLGCPCGRLRWCEHWLQNDDHRPSCASLSLSSQDE